MAADPLNSLRRLSPYVGHRGWLGVRLDIDVDWAEIEQIVTDAYRLVAPKSLIAQAPGRT